MNKPEIYLKILLFNDYCTMDSIYMNHNASDRCSMYEIYEEDIKSDNFNELFQKELLRFHRNVDSLTVACYPEKNVISEILNYANKHSQKYIQHAKTKTNK